MTRRSKIALSWIAVTSTLVVGALSVAAPMRLLGGPCEDAARVVFFEAIAKHDAVLAGSLAGPVTMETIADAYQEYFRKCSAESEALDAAYAACR